MPVDSAAVPALGIGDTLPPVTLRDSHGEEIFFRSDRLAGNPIVIALCADAASETARMLLARLGETMKGLRDPLVCAFLVAPAPWPEGLVPGIDTRRNLRLLTDPGTLLRVRTRSGAEHAPAYLLVAGPDGRIIRGHALTPETLETRIGEAIDAARGAVTRAEPVAAVPHPPVIPIPLVLEPSLARALIDHFNTDVPIWPKTGLKSAGFDAERGDFKVREEGPGGRLTEFVLRSEGLVSALSERFRTRVVPEIAKAFGMTVSRQEPFRIVRYEGLEGGHVLPHRDTGAPGTEHRKCTISIVLNTGDFEGGWLRFPEYGPQAYALPVGTGVVWSAQLLHEVTPVTRGERYMLGAHLF